MNNRKEITILVTDSGLGGLSVVADVFNKLKKKKQYKKVNLIFADALFDANSGYNKLSSHNEKVSIFSKALAGMEKHFVPDIILIACNTLSVLYDETNFAKETKTEVVGIVEFGVKIIQDELRKTNDSKVDLGEIIRDVDELMIINDEAHHVHDEKLAWFKSIEDITHFEV